MNNLICEISGKIVNEEIGYSIFGTHIVSEEEVVRLGLNTPAKIKEYFPDYEELSI